VNVNLLIDNIVRQTTVLIAQLATASGGRAPLAHVAGQVFVELVRELKAQGLGNKVIADMFGLTLRTYHDRVRRTRESVTERGTSLWEAVLRYVRAEGVVSRATLLRRFRADDEASVRGVLTDLVENGLVFKAGRQDATTYRAASPEETGQVLSESSHERTENLLWVWLHQRGAAGVDEIARDVGLDVAATEVALQGLLGRGHVALLDDGSYRADDCVIPYGDERGFEAALFDHFQAVLTAMGHKLSSGTTRSAADQTVGGSTYHFDLYPGHPLESEVLGLLASVRERASALRGEVDRQKEPRADEYRVVFYAGQNVIGRDEVSHKEGVER
jgi:hypothetical protein